ncbi:DUF7553 family protein [Halobacterium litoreum]|uniref:Uncharacterized protein n=1 Tax=Halobacterium litoreum TaxID=2039234 RepID=A0ABD5NCQ4_9EURY|nr:hypothetical protein [Halobacterium litoreum]UHH14084.1 hypothetical protein LT972_03560 [Halobacterium litoreum]
MNRHFRDAQYYARRTAEEVATGIREELEPVTERVRERVDREDTDEPTGVRDRAREQARGVRQRI